MSPRISDSFVPITSPETTSSTRRFCCRPAAVSFVATGVVSPKPFAVRISGLSPCVIRYSRTDSARCSDSRWLYASLPTLSVCPSTSISKPGCERTIPATRASFSRATGRSVYFAVSNRTSDMFTIRPRAVSRVSRIMLN